MKVDVRGYDVDSAAPLSDMLALVLAGAGVENTRVCVTDMVVVMLLSIIVTDTMVVDE